MGLKPWDQEMCDKNGLIISWDQYSTGLVIVLMLVESCETQQKHDAKVMPYSYTKLKTGNVEKFLWWMWKLF